ncbi:MAG: hypothetical protein ABSC51_10545, partial [Gaiellaceae bacterium]
ITNRGLVSGSKTVKLSLSSPSSGAVLGTQKTATLTILDNDSAPPPAKLPGKLTSAKLSKKSFPSSLAGKVKLTCIFSPKSKVFRYVLSRASSPRAVGSGPRSFLRRRSCHAVFRPATY